MHLHVRDQRRPTGGWRIATLAVGSFLLSGLAVWACNVPVYRVALERWRSDAYRAELLHRGPLTESQQEFLAAFEQQLDAVTSNIVVRAVDVAAPTGRADADWLETQEPLPLPQLVVRYPAQLRIEVPVWTAPWEKASLASLLESPARSELIRRLAEGQTAVYLLVEGDSPEENAGTVARLESKLKQLEQELKLPELTESPDDELMATTPLKVAFSVLRVRRDDPREQALVGMLVRAEPDLFERREPMAFPVFGRGRALLPLVGPGITADNIAESAAFLVGPCSCEIKELNHGFDLLLTAAWDQLILGDAAPREPLASQPAENTSQVELVPIPSGAQPPTDNVPPPASGSPSPRQHYLLLAIAAMLLAGMLVVRYALGR